MKNYTLQTTSLWSFPDRGSWATHRGDYRGNWSPHIPRNLILKYSKEGETILDCFCGSGTSLIETKLLNRNGIGIDINPKAIKITQDRLNFSISSNTKQRLFLANSEDLSMIKDETIDLVCTHPPYANIIHYSSNLNNDISNCSIEQFYSHMGNVANELYRVLKKKHFCAFMIGDIRKNSNVIPLGFNTMKIFTDSGFTLKEIIIKEQHNCRGSDYWKAKNKCLNFYLLAHEYIFILYK